MKPTTRMQPISAAPSGPEREAKIVWKIWMRDIRWSLVTRVDEVPPGRGGADEHCRRRVLRFGGQGWRRDIDQPDPGHDVGRVGDLAGDGRVAVVFGQKHASASDEINARVKRSLEGQAEPAEVPAVDLGDADINGSVLVAIDSISAQSAFMLGDTNHDGGKRWRQAWTLQCERQCSRRGENRHQSSSLAWRTIARPVAADSRSAPAPAKAPLTSLAPTHKATSEPDAPPTITADASTTRMASRAVIGPRRGVHR